MHLNTSKTQRSTKLRALSSHVPPAEHDHRRAAATGSGKTLISVMLIKEKSRELQPHLELGKGRKFTVFLAPQVALVFQVCGLPLSD